MASSNSNGSGQRAPQRDHEYEGNPLLAGISSQYITFASPEDARKETYATRVQKVQGYLTADITTRWADLVLIVCFALSGLIDSGAYNAYECFVSMMTGNTIFAALGVSDLPVSAPRHAWTKSVCSILAFLLGALLTSVFHRALGERKRWVVATSFAVQAAMIAVSAYLVQLGRSSGSPVKKPSTTGFPADPGFPWLDLVPIALLSFQAAGKVVASRVLQYNALPSVVLTTLYNDLVSDPGLLTGGLLGNVGRNRRLGGLLFYIGGAVAGGAFVTSSLGFSGLLWTAAALKLGVVLAWLLWREEVKKEDSGEA
ncbi:hypothetical protein LTR36_002385 [Oleoguttula mirabilis]|uniref:DUF1275 domain protein n=1 Tax=Oleoguttula mirabilis TaxID=1507867 RepID=A0AAV9JLC2_9PEZI|nr:hypothetical protein LTR36_002385 [Oleoguttula mirabilis]